jgi:glycine betaine transporter
VFGPTGFLGNLFFRSVGQYGSDFLGMSLHTPLNGDDAQWYQSWTYFMMAWWLSWGAFVGVFLAKISRGRTIRQFVAGVMGVPLPDLLRLVHHLRRHRHQTGHGR